MMLLVLVVGGLMILGIFGAVLLGSVGRSQKKAEANADQILDESFDGRPDVTVTVNMSTLKYETVIAGAKQRGYKLAHQADNQYGPHTLMFEKA
jgi:hypothetical protein